MGRKTSHKEAGRVKSPCHAGRWDSVRVSRQKEGHVGFHSSVSSYTSLPPPAYKSHQQLWPAGPTTPNLLSFP